MNFTKSYGQLSLKRQKTQGINNIKIKGQITITLCSKFVSSKGKDFTELYLTREFEVLNSILHDAL